MARGNRRKLGARHYKNYTEETLLQAVNAVKTGAMSSREAENQFNIPRKTILNKVKEKHCEKVGHPTALTNIEERHFVDVLIACAEYGSPLTMIEMRMLIKNYLDSKGRRIHIFTDNIPGKVWLDSFIRRHKHRLTKRHCQNLKRSRAEKTDEEMEDYFNRLGITVNGVKPEHIINYDETNLSDNPGTQKCIFRRGTKYPERYMNSTKSAVSLMFAATATGQLLPLYVVYKSERLYDRWVSGGPPQTIYNRSKSGWFDSGTFEDWFQKIIVPWAKKDNNCPKVVIGDNLSSHINVDILRACQRLNIRFVFLPPNSTQITQPLDVSLFRPVKQAWRSLLTDIKLKQPTINCVEKSIFPQLLSKLMAKIQTNVKKNIQSGFRATGIFPFNPHEVLKKMPNKRFEQHVTGEIDNVLLDYLKERKSNHGETLRRGKKTTLKIKPGESVRFEDINNKENETDQNGIEEENIELFEEESEAHTSTKANIQDDDEEDTMEVIEDEAEAGKCVPEPNNEFSPYDLEEGTYVVVRFATNKTIKHFIGKILSVSDADDTYTIKFLRKNESYYIYPNCDDVCDITFLDIEMILNGPEIKRGRHFFKENLERFKL